MQLHNSGISASYSVQALLLIQALLWVAEQFDTPQTSLEISALLSLTVIIFPISLHSSHSLQVRDSKVVKDNASSRSLPLWISTIYTSDWQRFHSKKKKKAFHICCMHLKDFIIGTCQTANKKLQFLFVTKQQCRYHHRHEKVQPLRMYLQNKTRSCQSKEICMIQLHEHNMHTCPYPEDCSHFPFQS